MPPVSPSFIKTMRRQAILIILYLARPRSYATTCRLRKTARHLCSNSPCVTTILEIIFHIAGAGRNCAGLLFNTPQVRLTVTNEGNDIHQSANSLSFQTKNLLSAIYDFKNSRFYLPLSLNYSADKMQTDLRSYRENTNNKNDMTAGQLSVAFAPRYEYTHPKRIYVFRADVPVRMDYIYNRNHIQNEKDKFSFWTS